MFINRERLMNMLDVPDSFLIQATQWKQPVPASPTIIEESPLTREAHQARWWRINTVRLTVQELADLTGYSPQAIWLMERGITSQGTKIKTWAWQRFKMACAGVEQRVLTGHVFEWMKTPESKT